MRHNRSLETYVFAAREVVRHVSLLRRHHHRLALLTLFPLVFALIFPTNHSTSLSVTPNGFPFKTRWSDQLGQRETVFRNQFIGPPTHTAVPIPLFRPGSPKGFHPGHTFLASSSFDITYCLVL